MENDSNICQSIQNLFDNFLSEDSFRFKNNILLKYLTMQESLPFQTYFKNQFVRLIKKDSLKKYLFLKKIKENPDIINSLIENINNKKKQIKQNNNKSIYPYNKKYNLNNIENSKDKQHAQSMINDSNNKINNNNIIEILNDKKNSKSMNEKSDDKQFNNSNVENSNDRKYKKENDKDESKSIIDNSSNMSFNMNIFQGKLQKKVEFIEEIISQKQNLLNQIINENNEPTEHRVKYFDDLNYLSGIQFESAGIKYIFQLLNCLSLKQDFNFYYNIDINSNILNKVFEKYKLKEVQKVQLDFVISDLKIIDFVNMLIYLYPNIIDLNNLIKKPFEKGMDLNTLENLRNKYKNSHKKIDIFGEIGYNIFNEDEKINQSIKIRTIYYNIKELLKKNEKEADEILENLKMKKKNRKIVLYLTNGEYSKMVGENFEKLKIIKAQNEYNINSLIIYLNINNNCQEKNYIENLILTTLFNLGKKKFIEQLINLKKIRLKQSIINDKFKSISFKLNNIEKKLRAIEKYYSSFIKDDKKNLNMNELTTIFFEKGEEINMDIKFDMLKKIELNENMKCEYEANIILLHDKKEIVNTKAFFNLQNDKIKVYDLVYKQLDEYFSSFEENKNELMKKRNKKIYFIISSINDIGDFSFLQVISKHLITNYLSYLYIVTKNNISIGSLFFHKKHMYIYSYSKDVEDKIKQDIQEKLKEVVSNNYKKFFNYNQKYNKIIDEYNKNYKFSLIINENDKISNKKNNFEDIINAHTQLLIEKISQDISFYLNLSFEGQKNIANLIEKDLKEIISKNNNEIFDSYLKHETITSELRNIMNSFIKTLKENNNNDIFMDSNEEEMNIQYDNEIISIDGIQEIYEDDIDDERVEIENNSEEDNGDDILNNKDSNKLNTKIVNEERLNENQIDNEDNFKIELLIREIEDTLKYSIMLINLKIYYKYFSNIVRKIFTNKVAMLISEKILEKEI